MRFTTSGSVCVVAGGREYTVTRAQARAVFALLMLHAGHPLSREFVIESLWSGGPPATARAQVSSAVHAIRRCLEEAGAPQLLRGAAHGYQLDARPVDVDVLAFEQQVRHARQLHRAGAIDEAARTLRACLAAWTGEPLAGAAAAFVTPTRTRLTEQRLSVVEEAVDLELRLGRDVAAELAGLVAAHPLRETLRTRFMIALYRSGRAAEALADFREYRRMLAEDVGIDPGAALAEVEIAILRADPRLADSTPRRRPEGSVEKPEERPSPATPPASPPAPRAGPYPPSYPPRSPGSSGGPRTSPRSAPCCHRRKPRSRWSRDRPGSARPRWP
jgi:DNA-binding SARP family transcriptional activator